MAGDAHESTTTHTKDQHEQHNRRHRRQRSSRHGRSRRRHPRFGIRSPPAARTGLILLIVVAALVVAGSVFYGLWLSFAAGVDKSGHFGFEASYAAPMIGDEVDAPVLPGTGSEALIDYSTVTVSAPLEQLREPQLLLALATAIPFLIVIVGGLGVIALAWRLLGSKPFSGAARGVLAALGVLAILNSALVPWLEARSSARAIEILALPTDGTMVPSNQHGWVVAPHFGFLQDAYWPYLTLGVLLMLVAILWRKAARLQQETEGLV
ncbi:hypothetical protein [Leucobacter soli]|uniref:hypothetical protein n=1 Tax=Leucobacter soli TaxID=2812850 RepID=UPI0036139BAF